ncbi:MAG TPA: C40 family peptidase [Mycobacteriales bacterium]|nr:C40 family peptidase [Mycobacteriales bacterium]
MPNAVPSRFVTLRIGIIAALSATFLSTLAGVAGADTAPPSDGSTTSQSPGTDPGQPDPSSPSGSTDGTTPTDGSTDGSTDTTSDTAPTITFGMPRAVASARAAHMRSVRARHAVEVQAVLREASRQRGKPYSYGGSGPRVFDCSGLVRYVFGHAVDRWLPHNAAAQYHSVMHIKRRDLQPGDLVFQESGGYPYHVGIYAGHGKWWHAPHTGTVVQKQRIYHGRKYYGRVLTYGFANHHMRHAHRAHRHAHPHAHRHR